MAKKSMWWVLREIRGVGGHPHPSRSAPARGVSFMPLRQRLQAAGQHIATCSQRACASLGTEPTDWSGECLAPAGCPAFPDASLQLLSKMRERIRAEGLTCRPRPMRANQRAVVRSCGASGVSPPGFESSSVPSERFISNLLHPRDCSNTGVTSCEVSRNYSHSPLPNRDTV